MNKFYNLNLSDDNNEKLKINQELWEKLNQEQQDLFKLLRLSPFLSKQPAFVFKFSQLSMNSLFNSRLLQCWVKWPIKR